MNELELKNVSKSFLKINSDDTTHALDTVNLTVKSNEFISIVGPSGCGKSTILRLIAGLISPTTGSISLDSKAVEGTDKERAMVFQKPTLFPWLTVEENVAFSIKLSKDYDRVKCKEEVHKFISAVGLSDFAKSYPSQLSGGMAQRIALIRTMISRPKVLLMDEPLGALDAFTRMKIQDEILSLYASLKNIVIMVTHDVDEAIYMSDRVVVMQPSPGRIKKIVDIELERPRSRTDNNFTSYRNEIMDLLNI